MALEEYTPLTDEELDAMEQRAQGPTDWPAAEVLRLIAEIRRLRDARERASNAPDLEESRPIWDEIVELMQDVPDEEWARLPVDGSANLDHYLFGGVHRAAAEMSHPSTLPVLSGIMVATGCPGRTGALPSPSWYPGGSAGEEPMRTVSDQLLQEMTERLVTQLHPEEIILFGSRAWGTPRDDSDVDLLIIVPTGTNALADQELRARRCLRGLGVPKDILVRTRERIERYRDVPASLEAQVLSRGKVLYADPERGAGAELVGQSAARPRYGS
jgi:predicted nucleotidyltransferase